MTRTTIPNFKLFLIKFIIGVLFILNLLTVFKTMSFKIIHGFDDVKSNTWFNIVGSGQHRPTRLTADPLNLIPSRSRLELRPNFVVK